MAKGKQPAAAVDAVTESKEEKTVETSQETVVESSAQSEAQPAATQASGGALTSGAVRISNKTLAGKRILAVSGEVIAFDIAGIAQVNAEDAAYLLQCEGYSKA